MNINHCTYLIIFVVIHRMHLVLSVRYGIKCTYKHTSENSPFFHELFHFEIIQVSNNQSTHEQYWMSYYQISISCFYIYSYIRVTCKKYHSLGFNTRIKIKHMTTQLVLFSYFTYCWPYHLLLIKSADWCVGCYDKRVFFFTGVDFHLNCVFSLFKASLG